jgi:DNA-binding PadR family transcriptional regulator
MLEIMPELNIRERILKAFLDLVIMCMLRYHSMSSYEINKTLTTGFGIIIGPSTIYSKLYTLEKQGSVTCSMSRSGKVYSLTEQGRQTTDDISDITEEICRSIKLMFRNQK